MLPVNSEIRFEVSTFCNHKCIFCRNDVLEREKQSMSIETFKMLLDKVMKETDQYSSLSFAGLGEPLMDVTLEDKIAYVKKKYPQLHMPMVTNGSLLTEKRFLSLQEAGVDIIRISFHGGTEEAYSTTHVVNDFKKVLGHINAITDKKLNTHVKLVVTFAVIEGVTDQTVDNWMKLWEGNERIWLKEIWRAHNWTSTFKFRKVQKKKRITCGRVFKAPLQIQVDGTVNMCCFDFDGKLLLGDLKTQSLKQIYSSPAFQKIAGCHTTGNFSGSNLLCENCDQRNESKSDALIYSSLYPDKSERVTKASTSYKEIV